MDKIVENALQKFPLDDFGSHLQLVLDALAESNDASIMLRRQGDQVFVYYQRKYADEVNDLLENAKKEHLRKKSERYDREQAFQDFMEAQRVINQYLH